MILETLPKHHALLLEKSDRNNYALSFFEELRKTSPAHRFFNQTVIDMETAKALISWAQTPYHEERIALVSFHTIGIPAQNALLKLLEEPPLLTRFILVTSSPKNLIETFFSRVHFIREETSLSLNSLDNEVILFFRTKSQERMKLPFIVNLLSLVDEEGRKEKEKVKTFILQLADFTITTKNNSRYTKEILEMSSYVSDPSSSPKALLEYLALLLPQTSR